MRSVRRVLWVTTRFALLLSAAACQGSPGPNPSLTSLSPAQAYNDQPFPMALMGRFARPPLTIDTMTGAEAVPPDPFTVRLLPSTLAAAGPGVTAQSITWVDAQEIDATIPAGLPADSYDVDVLDPRGNHALLQDAFTSLGPDLQPPTLTLLQPSPGTVVGSLTPVTLEIAADDGVGHLQSAAWSVSSNTLGQMGGPCTVSGQPSRLVCSASFVAPEAPTPLETIQISATAQDTTGHQAAASWQMQVAWLPGLTSVSPSEGPTTGGTPLQIAGVNFIPGVSQILIDGTPIDPAGGTVVSDGQMTGTTVPHSAGIVALVIANGTGQSAPRMFQFLLPPVLRQLSPTSGPGSEPTEVTLVGDNFRAGKTQVFIIDGTGQPQPVKIDTISPYVITVSLPPGVGTISILVVDPVSGQSELPDAFQYIPTAPPPSSPDAG